MPVLPSLCKHPLLFQGDKTMHAKTTTFGIFRHFGPNIGLSGPFGAMPDQKNANEVGALVVFLIYVGTKIFAPY